MTANQHNLAAPSNPQVSADVIDISRWQPIDAFLDANPQFNLGQIRWLIRDKVNNGFTSCIKKVGRRYYIHDQLFAKWIISQG